MIKINHKKYSVRIQQPKPVKNTTTHLHMAAATDDTEKIEKFLPYYKNIDTKNTHGETPLFMAIKHNKREAAAIFLNNRANPNTNNRGETPLVHAIKNEFLECTMLLLKKGANPTIGKPRPESYLVEFYGQSPSDETIIENYKFIVPVHSKMLRMRLKPLYKQQQHKLYLLTKFILQHYLKDSSNDILMHIIHPLINDWIDTDDSSQSL